MALLPLDRKTITNSTGIQKFLKQARHDNTLGQIISRSAEYLAGSFPVRRRTVEMPPSRLSVHTKVRRARHDLKSTKVPLNQRCRSSIRSAFRPTLSSFISHHPPIARALLDQLAIQSPKMPLLGLDRLKMHCSYSPSAVSHMMYLYAPFRKRERPMIVVPKVSAIYQAVLLHRLYPTTKLPRAQRSCLTRQSVLPPLRI